MMSKFCLYLAILVASCVLLQSATAQPAHSGTIEKEGSLHPTIAAHNELGDHEAEESAPDVAGTETDVADSDVPATRRYESGISPHDNGGDMQPAGDTDGPTGTGTSGSVDEGYNNDGPGTSGSVEPGYDNDGPGTSGSVEPGYDNDGPGTSRSVEPGYDNDEPGTSRSVEPGYDNDGPGTSRSVEPGYDSGEERSDDDGSSYDDSTDVGVTGAGEYYADVAGAEEYYADGAGAEGYYAAGSDDPHTTDKITEDNRPHYDPVPTDKITKDDRPHYDPVPTDKITKWKRH